MITVERVRRTLRPTVKSTLRHLAAVVGATTSRRATNSPVPRVLCYHGVCDDPPDEWSVTPDQLRAHMDVIRREYVPVALHAVVDWLRGDVELSSRSVAVTFDDGFVDVLEQAAPILAEAGVPGTAFVASGLVEGRPPHSSYIATRPMMDWSQLSVLVAEGWTIGSHSLDHPPLAEVDDDEARRQLVESRAELEQRLGIPVTLFAYPYGTAGTVSERDHRFAEAAGYRAAFLDMTGRLRRVDEGGDLWALPRSKVLGTDRMMVVRGSLRGSMDLWRHVERRH